MSERLPIELILEILHCTAVETICVDRSAVVRLALTSRFVYQLVHPTLYHTMVMTDSNRSEISLLANDPSCAHIFRAVRRLLVHGDENWAGIDPHLMSAATSVDVCFPALEALCSVPEFRPLDVAVRYASLGDVGPSLPAAARSGITHVTGYFLGGPPDANVLPGDIGPLFDALPALTHIAFDAVDFTGAALDVAALDAVLRACLARSRLRAVVVRVAGGLAQDWPAVLECARKLRDPRVYAWDDERPMDDWEDYDASMGADAWAGRDIWSEALSLQSGAHVP